MGKLESFFQFTGSVGNVSAYRMKGVDKIIVRKKGGASRDRIKNSAEFEKTRQHNREFTGRAQGVHWTMAALRPLKAVADYSISGPINKLMHDVQSCDEASPIGVRNIALSRHGSLLQGFSFNRYTDLNTIVTTPLNYTISRETVSATIHIPELISGKNFFPTNEHPFFSVMVVLGVVPDLYYKKDGHILYEPSTRGYQNIPGEATTAWIGVNEKLPATILEVTLGTAPPANDYALVLSIGVCFGAPTKKGTVQQVKNAGAGKIVAVG